jgi:hypothetical protein
MATTLLLDLDGWDVCLDALGNWALASEPYSQSQDVASAGRVFEAEAYYDTSLGVPYFTDVLGKNQPTQILRARLQLAALTVPGVTDATAYLMVGRDRTMTGQIEFTTDDGTQGTATI